LLPGIELPDPLSHEADVHEPRVDYDYSLQGLRFVESFPPDLVVFTPRTVGLPEEPSPVPPKLEVNALPQKVHSHSMEGKVG
jgi:hypothetical protein